MPGGVGGQRREPFPTRLEKEIDDDYCPRDIVELGFGLLSDKTALAFKK